MIDEFLSCDWDKAPDAMDFERPYAEVIGRSAELVSLLSARAASGGHGDDERERRRTWAAAGELFVLAPAIVNVALNHSVCVQFGLPLHPTEYFEVDQAAEPVVRYSDEERDEAFATLERSIALARAAYALDPAFGGLAAAYGSSLPHGIGGFVYTSRRDKYTWRAAEPAKVRALASSVLKAGRPSLAIGAAHGAIMAGLFLAELLGCELWFLRFSMFKRNDAEPVVSARDERKIRSYGAGSGILVFDEDSASGATLSLLSARVKAMAPEARTGAVIRHQSAAFRPDHVGRVWWD